MHSSRMRNGRSLTVFRRGCLPGERSVSRGAVCLGGSSQEGLLGGVCLGVSAQGGVCLGDVCPGGVCPGDTLPRTRSRTPRDQKQSPPVNRILDTRYQKYYLGRNFVATGNNTIVSEYFLCSRMCSGTYWRVLLTKKPFCRNIL